MPDRRNLIMKKSAVALYRRGFGASTIADIVSAAGVGKGNFYRHFTGKQELGLAMIEDLKHFVGGNDLDEVFSPLKPPLRRLIDFLDIVRAERRRDNCGDPLGTFASELGATAPYADRLRTAMNGLLERIEALISEFALEVRASLDARLVARAVLAQVHGLCIQYKVDGDAAAFEAGISAIASLLSATIGAAPRAAGQSVTGRTQAVSR